MSANPSWSGPTLPPVTPSLVTEPPLSPTPAPDATPPVVPFAAPVPEPEPVVPVLPAPPVEEVAAPVFPAAPTPEPAPPLVSIPNPEPPAMPVTTYRILIRLDSGEQIEVAAHGDPAAARAEATTLMRYLRDGRGDWPFVAGRYVRPDRIVSVDVEETHF